MPLHSLRLKACPGCFSCQRGYSPDDYQVAARMGGGADCHGSGRVGDESGPRVEIADCQTKPSPSWHYRHTDQACCPYRWHGPYPTEAAALEAARESIS